jgi:hypothetical protein
VRGPLRDILVDYIVGEARERLIFAGKDGFDFRDPVRAGSLQHLLE